MNWYQIQIIQSKSYKCSYCHNYISSDKGYKENGTLNKIYICHHCIKPTFFDYENKQYPGANYGEDVLALPQEIQTIYDESRSSFSVNAYTASVMCSRKILMNVAVNKGADTNEKFIYYFASGI